MRIYSLYRFCGFHLLAAPLFFGTLFLTSCERRYDLSIEPPAARIAFDNAIGQNGGSPLLVYGEAVLPGHVSHHDRKLVVSLEMEGWEPARVTAVSESVFRETDVTISMTPLFHELSVEVVNGNSSVLIDGSEQEGFSAGGGRALVVHGVHQVTLSREGFANQTIEILLDAPRTLRLKHQKTSGPARSIGVFPTGSQPKQVVFTPDNRYLVVPLLNDVGFDFIALEGALRGESTAFTRIPAPEADCKGYVEPLILPDIGSLWISQMTTGMIHEYRLPCASNQENTVDTAGPPFVTGAQASVEASSGTDTPSFLRTVSARGSWTKVMASDPARRWIAVSNWITNDVVVLERETGLLVKKLVNLAVPRGLVFSGDGAHLFVASYDGNTLYRFSTESWKETKRFVRSGAAMRHIVLSPDGSSLFVNDMRHSRIFRLSTADLSLEKLYRVDDSNPNTIDLDPAGKRLFVSCRGPNNPGSYLLRSPRDGHVYIIDVDTGDVLQTLVGGNQPTGLDVSADGCFLAFTNFLDDTVEVYALSETR